MAIDAARLYAELKALAQQVPDFSTLQGRRVPDDMIRWCGRLQALVHASGDVAAAIEIKFATKNLDSLRPAAAIHALRVALHGALEAAELHAPVEARGAFIAVGNVLDAYAAVGEVLASAQADVFIVDPYLDDKALTDFGVLAAEGVRLGLLSDERSVKPSLEPAANRWIAQYGNLRPLEVRLSPPASLHDRLILIDGNDGWVLTQSLKDLAARSPATLQKVDADLAAMKVAAYSALWQGARIVAR